MKLYTFGLMILLVAIKDAAKLPEPVNSSAINKPLKVAQIEVQGWKMIFRATAGNGNSAYEAWATGQDTTTEKPTSMARSLDSHFRDSIVDDWSDLDIEYVKIAFYSERSELAYIIFEGAGSSLTDWFGKSKLVSSSWPDLTSTADYNFFSIAGDGRYARRFFINNKYTGCANDRGHIVVKEDVLADCDWDRQPVFPQFLYSQIASYDYWNNLQYGRADYLVIFVQK